MKSPKHTATMYYVGDFANLPLEFFVQWTWLSFNLVYMDDELNYFFLGSQP